MTEEAPEDSRHVMVGECPEHGLVAGDAIEGKFPNTVSCVGCGSELSKCIAGPREPVENNEDVRMEFK